MTANIKSIIAGMLKENTGIHMLDSGFEGGRAWQRNQGRDFEKEPGSILEIFFGDRDLIISKSTYHYLTKFLEVTPESERLQREFQKFASLPEYEDMGWPELMKGFFKQHLQPEIKEDGWESYNINSDENVTNTYQLLKARSIRSFNTCCFHGERTNRT